MTAIDDPSANTMDMLDTVTLSVSGRTMMIDPTMGEVGEFTGTCAGERGVLQITMPDGSHGGMAWSHISQMGDSYRMNFPGYSMANPTACRAMVADDTAQNDDELARIDMCM